MFLHDIDEWENADKIYEINAQHHLVEIQRENVLIQENLKIGGPFESERQIYHDPVIVNDLEIEMNTIYDLKSAKISGEVYKIYLNLDKFFGILVFALFLFGLIGFQVITIMADSWVAYWYLTIIYDIC